jgi:hypothetical protein
MKNIRQTYSNTILAPKVGALAFLLLLMPLWVAPSVHVASAEVASNTCPGSALYPQIEILGRTNGLTEQQEIDFATSSQQYTAAASAFNSTIASGANDIWSFNSNCIVSWSEAIVTFEVRAANGSTYNLAVAENPKVNAIYSVSITPSPTASPVSSKCTLQVGGQTQCEWAGWAIAGNSEASDQVYSVQSEWYVQEPLSPASGESCDSPDYCDVEQWDGLTNANSNPSDILQAVTDSLLEGTTASYSSVLEEYSSNGNFIDSCPATYENDEMYGTVNNELVENGTSGSDYYMYLTDYSQSWICTPSGNNPISISWTPYYAAYESELPLQFTDGSSTNYVLAGTNSMEFEECQFALGASVTGIWNYWDAGDGFGSSIYNNDYNDSYPAEMLHNSGTYVGYFDVAYYTSLGTPP